MYVAVKGGERAIENAHRLLAHERRGDRDVPELTLSQISEQLSLGVDRVMTEGSLYDRELASLAIKQARGDLIEAIFLVRAFRATLPRFGATEPVDTGAMQVRRRISSTFKDIPGGQILGPTFDYTHRLLDPQLAEGFEPEVPASGEASTVAMPRVTDILGRDGLIEPSPAADGDAPVGDLTREPLSFPAERDLRLQNLARADEGFLLALGYSSQRGYGRNHPFAGEIRFGEVEVEFTAEDAGFAVPRVATLDVVAEPLIANGTARAEAREKAGALLRQLNIPERLWTLPPSTFSGGEQQRVNIARGFISDLPILLLDEPTASLDGANRAVVVELVARKKQQGVAMVAIVHDDEIRHLIADRIVDVTSFAAAA